MTRLTHALLATLVPLALVPAAEAGEAMQATTVYELFTSQGCSSCPPANAQIDTASKQDGVLALSYGVTYWDYLGWKDTFAKPEFTERQRAYVKALGARSPYTPQIVRNGAAHNSRMAKLARKADVLHADVALRERGAELEALGNGQAVLVRFAPGRHAVPVKAGENGGRTVGVTNVVEDVELVSLPHTITPMAGKAYALLKHGDDLEVTSAAAWTP